MDVIYKISAQSFSPSQKKTLIIFQQIGKLGRIIQSAEEIVKRPHILNGFCQRDISLISYIAGMEAAERLPY